MNLSQIRHPESTKSHQQTRIEFKDNSDKSKNKMAYRSNKPDQYTPNSQQAQMALQQRQAQTSSGNRHANDSFPKQEPKMGLQTDNFMKENKNSENQPNKKQSSNRGSSNLQD